LKGDVWQAIGQVLADSYVLQKIEIDLVLLAVDFEYFLSHFLFVDLAFLNQLLLLDTDELKALLDTRLGELDLLLKSHFLEIWIEFIKALINPLENLDAVQIELVLILDQKFVIEVRIEAKGRKREIQKYSEMQIRRGYGHLKGLQSLDLNVFGNLSKLVFYRFYYLQRKSLIENQTDLYFQRI
jgi:hypothetical protein